MMLLTITRCIAHGIGHIEHHSDLFFRVPPIVIDWLGHCAGLDSSEKLLRHGGIVILV